MPISNFTVVASKYVSVIYTVAISILGSIAFNSLSSIIFQNFDMLIWLFSIAAAIIIPLLWTGICLPLTYWFGFHSAQTMGLIVVIPMFYFVKYFEDGPGMAAMVNSVQICYNMIQRAFFTEPAYMQHICCVQAKQIE